MILYLCVCVWLFFIQVLRNLSMYFRTFRCEGMRSVKQLDREEGMVKTNALYSQLLSAVFDAWKISCFYGGLMLLSCCPSYVLTVAPYIIWLSCWHVRDCCCIHLKGRMTTHCAHQFLPYTSTLYMYHVIAKKSGEYDKSPQEQRLIDLLSLRSVG
jgi:hypothetical protein